MTNFYENLPLEAAEQLEPLSRLSFQLRENRKNLLAQYQVADEVELLNKILSKEVSEHPAYDHYLSASMLKAAQQSARDELQAVLDEYGDKHAKP